MKFTAQVHLLFGFVILFLFCSSAQSSFAAANATSFAIANYLPISDTQVSNGSIVSFSPKGYSLSKIDYDPLAVGVVTTHPAISLQLPGTASSYAVVSSGDTLVLVSSINGAIKKGDPITTSTITGVGMKATQTGYIIGVSLDNYSSQNKSAAQPINVRLNFHYNIMQSAITVGFWDVLNLSTLATYEQPIKAFQYLVASIVVVISFVMSFFLFARTANKGLEALGRNPLASRMIQIGILLNVSIAISIIVAGLIIAFIMLRL
jgi:F0F1-type ATP synthase membrane subunit c/vacuolar-type H+-ATPase subunit K